MRHKIGLDDQRPLASESNYASIAKIGRDVDAFESGGNVAVITAAGNGVWSATGTWTGGVLPGGSDDADSNGFTVTIDQDITVHSLIRSNTGGSGFVCTPGASVTRTINAIITSSVAGYVLTVNIGLNASSIVNLNGAITQGSAGTPLLLHGTGTNTSATVNIAGDITGAGTNGSAVIQSDNAAGKFTTNITGNFYGGKYGTLYLDYAGTITITGSVATNTTTADSGVVAINSGALTLNWAGTLIGSTVGQGYALKQGAGTVTITGNVTGGSANDSYGVDVISGTCTVNGIATGGTGLRAYGVLNNTGTSSVTVDTATGNGYGPGGATNPVPGVWGNNGASLTTKVKKIISGAYGQSGVGGAVLLLSDAANKSTMRTVYNGATRDLVPSGGAFNPVGSAIIGAGMQV